MKARLRDGRIVRLRTIGQTPSKIPAKGQLKSAPTPALVRQLVNAPSADDVERIAKTATRAQIQEILDSLAEPRPRTKMPWYRRAAGGVLLATPFAVLPFLVGLSASFGGRVQRNRDMEHDGRMMVGASMLALLGGAGLGLMSSGYSYPAPSARQLAAYRLLTAMPEWLEANKFIIPDEDDFA